MKHISSLIVITAVFIAVLPNRSLSGDIDTAAHAAPGSAPGAAPSAAPGSAPGSAPGAAPETPLSLDAAETATPAFLERSFFVISKIRDNSRQVDPFGMPMDPTNAKETPILADQYADIEEAPVLTSSSLKSALQTLPITGLYPKQQMVVLGARTFHRGGHFGMKLDELTIRLRFEGIRGTSVYFKDLDTQEIASVEFNTTPKEFEPITKKSKMPLGEGIQKMEELFIVN